MNQIADIKKYNEMMRKSFLDKAFFLDKVSDAKIFIDFGCADGSFLKYMKELFPDYFYIGYDISEEMIEIANEDSQGIHFTNDWTELQTYMNHTREMTNEKVCLFALSVVHEVYSYTVEDVKRFWKDIQDLGADYLVFRDMAVSTTASRQSDPVSVARIRQRFDPAKIREWEGIWGSLNENWSLTHFLLTYRYTHNWERECRENYLPLAAEEFLTKIDKKYIPIYHEHYTLPFIRDQVEKDFSVDLQERTHLKLIFKLN